MYGVVYLTTNLINGKQYVGQHKHNSSNKYYRGGGTVLHRAWKKYGKDNFSFDILEEADSFEVLNAAEKRWIAVLETKAPCGYNLTEGGDGTVGYVPSIAARRKMSNKLMGNKHTKGQKRSVEQRQHMSDAQKNHIAYNKGLPCSAAQKQSISEKLKGRIPWNKGKLGCFSEDTLKAMSNSHKGISPVNKGIKGIVHLWSSERPNPAQGKKRSAESIRKQKEHSQGRVFSEEHRRHLSEAGCGRHLYDSNHPNPQKGKLKHSIETRLKMSQIRKGKTPCKGAIIKESE